ncbi:MAG: hypothetical protein IKC31_07185 [Clostridia bacterium]|nr:hypothetical protein [Clostridia bacterium]
MENKKMISDNQKPRLSQAASGQNEQGKRPTDAEFEALFDAKCQEVSDACCDFAQRIKRDWKETNGNPYIKKIDISRVEIYRKPTDTVPVDIFESRKEHGYTLQSLVLTTAASVLLSCTAKYLVKSMLKKL